MTHSEKEKGGKRKLPNVEGKTKRTNSFKKRVQDPPNLRLGKKRGGKNSD